MDNVRAVIRILFRHVSEQDIFNNKFYYDNISLDDFVSLANSYMLHYSNDELRNLYTFLKTELKWMKHKVFCENDDGTRQADIDVFTVLQLFVGEVLVEENGRPVCQYIHLLRWHEMAKEVGEDLLTTAYLAYKDVKFKKKREDFFWKPVIGHNSQMINKMLEKGVAENHFHLKGSAPLFQVSWISIMNNVTNPILKEKLDEYDKNRLKRNIAYSGGYKETSLYILVLRAACIRLYLFKQITGNFNEDEQELLRAIDNEIKLQNYITKLQGTIDYYHDFYNEYDYTICKSYLQKDKKRLNWLLSGERWFLYRMFSVIYSKEKGRRKLFQLFYWYLIIKSIIRAELIQVNENVGFDNFYLYENRKDIFVENTKYESIFIRMAVKDTIMNQHIEKLEARIAPKDTAKEIKDSIEQKDKWIVDNEEDITNKYFYVLHFVKKADNEKQCYELGVCRHQEKRNIIAKQARALANLREQDSDSAKRIKGIDACSAEILCRPEVFAQVFRYLKFHNVSMDVPQLKCSYHVGEDFLDVIDGLRAIDEVISFLNFKCGDRFGHALALGVNIEEWYEKKGYTLLINKQDYLDNLVWVYGKIRKYGFLNCEDTVLYIKKKFDELIRNLYKKNISKEKAKEFSFSIDSYYDAWKLRGDNPSNYTTGKFLIDDFFIDEWSYHGINREFPRNYEIRYEEEVAYLYYLYHFNADIKRKGKEVIEVKVSTAIVKAVKLIQKRMQIEICERGIAIETNPSSNCFIGTFKRYDKHPIKEWYNIGLTNNSEELEKCPQLLVSINTDDQGVFNTYLENEYAYLALALEKMKNSDGTPKYKRTMIVQWLDNIRKMGLDQSF